MYTRETKQKFPFSITIKRRMNEWLIHSIRKNEREKNKNV